MRGATISQWQVTRTNGERVVFETATEREAQLLARERLPGRWRLSDRARLLELREVPGDRAGGRKVRGVQREAQANLFAGAIGMCKNPTSHRNVEVEADAAAELIVLASHLLRVDARSTVLPLA